MLCSKGSSTCSMSGRGVLGLFSLVSICHKSNRVGTHADPEPVVRTMPAKAVPMGKVSLSSSAPEMKLEPPPTTRD